MLLINPGSTLPLAEAAIGWTNTHDQAKKYAYTWFYKPMQEQGFTDIEVTDTGEETEGRWKFIFKHTVTGVEVELETHGIDDLEAYEKQFIFTPRVYWNGGSSSNPELEDFKADGFSPVMTYRRNDKPNVSYDKASLNKTGDTDA
jgi:hypothetical protein